MTLTHRPTGAEFEAGVVRARNGEFAGSVRPPASTETTNAALIGAEAEYTDTLPDTTWADLYVRPDEVAAWEAAGFTPDTANEWHEADICHPVDAQAWRDAGFDGPGAHSWMIEGFDPDEAQGWELHNFDSYDARSWNRSDFQAQEAAAWRDAGWNCDDACDWRACGFEQPESVEPWHAGGFDANEASSWRIAGFDCGDAVHWRDQGYDVESAEMAIDAGHLYVDHGDSEPPAPEFPVASDPVGTAADKVSRYLSFGASHRRTA